MLAFNKWNFFPEFDYALIDGEIATVYQIATKSKTKVQKRQSKMYQSAKYFWQVKKN